jgi:hypothetical protein
MMLPKLNTWPHGVICGHSGGLSRLIGHWIGVALAMSTSSTSSHCNAAAAAATATAAAAAVKYYTTTGVADAAAGACWSSAHSQAA